MDVLGMTPCNHQSIIMIIKCLLNCGVMSPCSTGPWHHWVVGIGPAAAVLASSGQGS